MLTKAAYDNTPYRTPAEIRGPSLRALHLQKKMNAEMEDLLSTDSPAAGAAAFAKGVAAGAALPLVIGGLVPWATEVRNVHSAAQSQIELAELLTTRGIPKEHASSHAATIYHYLEGQKKAPANEALEAIRGSMKTYEFTEPTGRQLGPFPRRKDAVNVAKKVLGGKGWPLDRIEAAIQQGAVQEVPAPASLKRGVSPGHVAAVLEDAAQVFQKGTTSSIPGLAKAHGLHALKSLRRAAVPAALLGGIAGSYGYLRHRKKKKTLEALRDEQARRVNRMRYQMNLRRAAR